MVVTTRKLSSGFAANATPATVCAKRGSKVKPKPTVNPVPRKGNDSGIGKAKSSVAATSREKKMSSLSAIIVAAGVNNVNLSRRTKPSKPLPIVEKMA